MTKEAHRPHLRNHQPNPKASIGRQLTLLISMTSGCWILMMPSAKAHVALWKSSGSRPSRWARVSHALMTRGCLDHASRLWRSSITAVFLEPSGAGRSLLE